MITLKVDASGLKKIETGLARMAAKIPAAIAYGLNDGGNQVRTAVQRALQTQTSLVKYSSVTSRVTTIGASAIGMAAKSGVGPSRPGRLSYMLVVHGSPATKPREFRVQVQRGRGGGVTILMWGTPHKFKRSFQEKYLGGLRARIGGERFPVRGFDGPNLAKEAVKDRTRAAFYEGADTLVMPLIERQIWRALK